MLKIIKFFLLLALFTSQVYTQTYFQRITAGSLVTDTNKNQDCAWCDYDNDGFLDVVISSYNDYCTTCTYPIFMYHNNGDGTFTRVTTGPIANYIGRTHGVAWGDYDNDGRPDLFVCTGWGYPNLLFHNEGNGVFTQVTTGQIVNDAGQSLECSWLDYDRDGWLDLFVSNANNQSNYLYHNNGNGSFTKITTGNIVTDVAYGRGCAVGDYDNDGWPDVFVTTYQGQNDELYHNNHNGTFTKITSGIEVNDGMWGSSCSWGDYDNDGWLDLYVINCNQVSRLYHNDHNGNFSLVNQIPSQESAYHTGTSWGDYDNNGWLDLVVCNYNTVSSLYSNTGGIFTKITTESPTSIIGINLCWVDYNNDGKLDLLITSDYNNDLFRNVGATGNYLEVKLHGCMPRAGYSNTMGIGARIKIRYGNNLQIREVGSVGSNNMPWQHFGLGSINVIDSLIVYWPSGFVQKLTNVNANQTLSIDECLIGIQTNTNEIPKNYFLAQNFPNPFNPTTMLKYQIPKNSFVNLEVFDYLGKKVTTLINIEQTAGFYEVEFNGENYSSGVYFYKITTGDFTEIRKMILMK